MANEEDVADTSADQENEANTNTEATSYFLNLGGSERAITSDLKGFVDLDEDERRMVVLAKSSLNYKKDLPEHRRKALLDFFTGYAADYVLTKTLMELRRVGF